MKKVEMYVKEYWHTCSDGCCSDYGINTKFVVDGKEYISNNHIDTEEAILKFLKEHMGIEITILYEDDDDV